MLRNNQLPHDLHWQLRQSLGFSEILIEDVIPQRMASGLRFSVRTQL